MSTRSLIRGEPFTLARMANDSSDYSPDADPPAVLEYSAAARDEVRVVVALIGGKWKLEILWLLKQRVYRFNELRRAIPGVTQHMLTMQLRELEADGLVRRTVYAEVPPRVEYSLTDDSRRLRPIFDAILAWAGEQRG